MHKIEYREPTANVIKLQHRNQLLTGSAGLQNYNWHDEEEE